MANSFLARKELIEKSRISEKVLNEWEEIRIVKPAVFTEDKIPFYTQQTIDHINKIRKFVEIGYTLEEIQRILKKVGLPKHSEEYGNSNKLKKHLTIGGLAERVGVSTRTIKHWEDKGIIEADMRSDGGFRLYSEIYVYLCNLVKDLQLFGYTLEEIKNISYLFRTFLTIEKEINAYSVEETEKELDTMCREIETLNLRMNLFKQGIQRWEELISKKTKEINALKKKNQKREQGKKGEKK
ncbi:MerR family transcriptional regulator [Acidobacteriota bacterium]